MPIWKGGYYVSNVSNNVLNECAEAIDVKFYSSKKKVTVFLSF